MKNFIFLLALLVLIHTQLHPKLSFVMSEPVILDQCEEGCIQGGQYIHSATLLWQDEAKTLQKLYKKHLKDCKKIHAILVDYNYLIEDDQMQVQKGPLEIQIQDEDQKPYKGERSVIIVGMLQNIIHLIKDFQEIGYEVEKISSHEKEVQEDQVSEEQYINTYQSIIEKGLERAEALCKKISKSSEVRVTSITELISQGGELLQQIQDSIVEFIGGENQEEEEEDDDENDDFELQEEEKQFITLRFQVECAQDKQAPSLEKEQSEYLKNRYIVMDQDSADL